MNTVTIARRNELTSGVLNSLHAFRREVFVDRLGWELPLPEGVERDQFDRDDTVYLTVCDDSEAVTACARLLPTQGGAYMLPELFPELLGGRPAPRDSAVWELSRFATSVRATREGRVLSLSQPTLDLLGCVFECAAAHDIARLVLVTSIAIERLLLRAGLDVHRVAAPAQSHGKLYVALYVEVPKLRPDGSPQSEGRGLYELQSHGAHDRLSLVRCAELLHGVVQVKYRRARGDAENLSELPSRLAVR